MGNRDTAVICHGLCGEGFAGGSGLLPECGSDLQMHSGVSGIPLWELDSEADKGIAGIRQGRENIINIINKEKRGIIS